jgi:hypothetical protein
MSRALARKAASRQLVGRKSSPQKLAQILKCLSEMPVIADVCRRTAVSRTGIKYWLEKSQQGFPGFDLPTGESDEDGKPITRRFHELWADALADGIDRVERAAMQLALGQHEPLTDRGRVQYKYDPDLLSLGLTGPDAYLKDKDGKPVPETIIKQDPDMIRFLLKAHRPDQYVATQKVDVNHRGGVLVVGVRPKSSAEFDKQTPNKLEQVTDVEFEEITDPTTDAASPA